MRILVISHNVFSKTTNMGRTLRSYFGDFSSDEIAQFYVHSEVPTDNSVCENYFRFTDVDVIKSIIYPEHNGKIYKNNIEINLDFSRVDSGLLKEVYQHGRKRTALTYVARDLCWKIGHWYTKQLKQWVAEFNPNLIFFAAGDYSFMYKIAYKITCDFDKPLVVVCMDDYYLFNKNEDTTLGRIHHHIYMNSVKKTMAKASAIFTICDTMKNEYAKLFKKDCYTLHTSVKNEKIALDKTFSDKKKISYIGNLGLKRYLQLIEIGKIIKNNKISLKWDAIDVYSAEERCEFIKDLTIENGIRFHGKISAEQVLQVMAESDVVIHVESFDIEMKKRTKYSVSTKIAESLMYGPCIFAYGPEGIASIDYLREHEAAYVVTNRVFLEKGLKEISGDEAIRNKIINNARVLAYKNHRMEENSKKLKEQFSKLIESDR